jgi:EmrB/QacA subfamily drug resistance transporter
MTRDRRVPLIVAVALFMDNMDSNVIATSLPAIAHDIGANPIELKLAVTSYLLSLAVFIPASGWTADRFGARSVFRAAIAVFMLGSICCAFSSSLGEFVGARIIQGMGGAMMTPVGRLVLVRSVHKHALVDAMAWVTIPAMIGPVLGPPLGGFITTYFTWHWIFLINIPIGILGIYLVTRYIDPVPVENPDPFDPIGMLLAGAGVAGLAFGLSVAGLDFLPWPVVAMLIGGGAISMSFYFWHARRVPAPVLDFTLFRLATFRAAVGGGFFFRLGVGAMPFLLPLMLQIGFGMSPLGSGLITFTAAIGAMGMKTMAAWIIGRFGFRRILVVNALLSSAFMMSYGLFTPSTPIAVMVGALVLGGFCRSLQFTGTNTLPYAEVEPRRMSRATSMAAVAQQLSISTGVAVGAFVVEATVQANGSADITAGDFSWAFLIVGMLSAASVFWFLRLPPDAGSEMAARKPPPAAKDPTN